MDILKKIEENFLLIAAALVFIVLETCGIAIGKFKGADFSAAIKASLMLAAAFWLKIQECRADEADSRKKPLEILWKTAILGAGLLLVNRGFEVYNAPGDVFKSLLFVITGIITCAIFGFYADNGGRQLVMPSSSYKKEHVSRPLYRLAVSIFLSLLGVYFIRANLSLPAFIAFLVMALQLSLVFRVAGCNRQPISRGEYENVPWDAKIISIVVTAAAFYFYYMSFKSLQAYELHMTVIFFIIGSALFMLAPGDNSFKRNEEESGKYRIFDLSFIIFIFGLGILINSFRLWDVILGLHGDSVINVELAKRIETGSRQPVFIESPMYQVTVLHYWLLALVGKLIGGINIISGKWVTVIVSSLTPVFVYLTIKELFNRRAAVLSSVFLAFFFMHIYYARFVMTWGWVPALAAASYYLFVLGMKRGKPAYFVFSGVVMCINVYMYSASKATPVTIALFLFLMLFNRDARKELFSNAGALALMAVAFILSFTPVFDYIINNPGKYLLRMEDKSVIPGFPFNPQEIVRLFDNVVMNLQMFFTVSAPGYAHNLPFVPFFDPFISFFAIAGTGFLFLTWKREGSAFIIAWLVAGLLPGFLSKLGPEDPYPARVVLAIPVVIIVVAIGVERAWSKIEGLWPRILKFVMPLLAVYFFAWFAFYNLNNYFVRLNEDPHTYAYHRPTDKVIADSMLKNRERIYLISPLFSGNYYWRSMQATFKTIATFKADPSLFELHRIFNSNGRDVEIIGEGIYYNLFPAYREYFPNARINTKWNYNFWVYDYDSPLIPCYGWKDPKKTIDLNYRFQWFQDYDYEVRWVMMSIADIPYSDIDSVFSLKAELYRKGEETEVMNVKGAAMNAVRPFDRAIVSGLVEAPDYGDYSFDIPGHPGALVYIDGRKVNGPVELYKGLHKLKVIMKKKGSQSFAIRWARGSSRGFANIERRFLVNSDKVYGLVASYRDNNTGGTGVYKMLETALDYRIYYYAHRPSARVTRKPFRFKVGWEGYIVLDKGQECEFRLDTVYNGKIYIDGKKVFSNSELGVQGKGVPVKLSKGRHSIKIDGFYSYTSTVWQNNTPRLMYKKEGHSEFGPVSYKMLRPF